MVGSEQKGRSLTGLPALMAPQLGLEPRTCRLTDRRSQLLQWMERPELGLRPLHRLHRLHRWGMVRSTLQRALQRPHGNLARDQGSTPLAVNRPKGYNGEAPS